MLAILLSRVFATSAELEFKSNFIVSMKTRSHFLIFLVGVVLSIRTAASLAAGLSVSMTLTRACMVDGFGVLLVVVLSIPVTTMKVLRGVSGVESIFCKNSVACISFRLSIFMPVLMAIGTELPGSKEVGVKLEFKNVSKMLYPVVLSLWSLCVIVLTRVSWINED